MLHAYSLYCKKSLNWLTQAHLAHSNENTLLFVPLFRKSLLELLESAPARYAPDEDGEVGIRRGAGPVLVPLVALVALPPFTS